MHNVFRNKDCKVFEWKVCRNLPYGYEYGEPNANGQVNILQVSREIEIVKGIYDALLNKECNSMQELCNDLNEKYKNRSE